ncbi:hypothetical protein MYVALT_F_01580 [Candidatus Vallotia tarda]|uniref:Uncharacterized protein n=1 Tax=Candidatus Vallotiella hemipterorum TaxID=1177213 RepID=A0A916NL90_9BURK|nr:hypothetical protein MYVALT_F_01580 [Candidatus Vallotia tarda]
MTTLLRNSKKSEFLAGIKDYKKFFIFYRPVARLCRERLAVYSTKTKFLYEDYKSFIDMLFQESHKQKPARTREVASRNSKFV